MSKQKCVSPVVCVLDDAGRFLWKTPRARAVTMLRLGSAIELPGTNCIRLTQGYSQRWSGRTHTSRKGVLAVIGRSQCYTTVTLSSAGTLIYGFKYIHKSDIPVFHAATLGTDV